MNFARHLTTTGLAAVLGLSALATPAADAQDLSSGLNHAVNTPTDAPIAGYDPFYDDPVPPEQLGSPGTMLRTKPAPHLLNVLGPDFPGHAKKILYTSTTVHGDPVATSGFVIEPANPWRGNGPTPTVVFAPGTRGSGDACAPSRGPWMTAQFNTTNGALGLNYELHSYEAAALLGMRVVVVDYIGLGTPGAHTYVLHDEEAHAVLDAARAVVPAGDPIAFYGYSQGGGAAAAAAELAPSYAPELNIKGTYAGAPPADLLATLDGVDNSAITAVLGYAANGWGERYPEIRDYFSSHANQQGRQFFAATSDSCITVDALRWQGTHTATLTTSGESLGTLLRNDPRMTKLFVDQHLGTVAPPTPIMVSTPGNDDLVPSGQVTQLARDYCAAGAQVTYLNENIPPLSPGTKLGANHAAGVLTQLGGSFMWILDRFNGVPMQSNCGTF
ncbi:lipase family protein [Corynebacterium liangguodongii]|uniref:Lipase n=1 Tax=Corynebacterium liangguodongii TaxID=2079535 RepID=A0A2S0WHA2_9CORY|nr:lipase family protein [Corynebacterium liangguodongii]AWB85143.1 lipase [Corynebacterium liangguodongii]PWB99768.1 lipase [Corynebacterium liangguodongii]